MQWISVGRSRGETPDRPTDRPPEAKQEETFSDLKTAVDRSIGKKTKTDLMTTAIDRSTAPEKTPKTLKTDNPDGRSASDRANDRPLLIANNCNVSLHFQQRDSIVIVINTL